MKVVVVEKLKLVLIALAEFLKIASKACQELDYEKVKGDYDGGGYRISHPRVRRLPRVIAWSPPDSSPYSILTAREREVLQLMAEGRNTKKIAESLFVSVKTVETHRKQLMDKLDIHSVAELTKYAIRQGLTSL